MHLSVHATILSPDCRHVLSPRPWWHWRGWWTACKSCPAQTWSPPWKTKRLISLGIFKAKPYHVIQYDWVIFNHINRSFSASFHEILLYFIHYVCHLVVWCIDWLVSASGSCTPISQKTFQKVSSWSTIFSFLDEKGKRKKNPRTEVTRTQVT